MPKKNCEDRDRIWTSGESKEVGASIDASTTESRARPKTARDSRFCRQAGELCRLSAVLGDCLVEFGQQEEDEPRDQQDQAGEGEEYPGGGLEAADEPGHLVADGG